MEMLRIAQPCSYSLTHTGRNKMAATFQTTFSNTFSWMKNVRILSQISKKQVSYVPINNNTALVKMISLRRLGDKPLAEPIIA